MMLQFLTYGRPGWKIGLCKGDPEFLGIPQSKFSSFSHEFNNLSESLVSNNSGIPCMTITQLLHLNMLIMEEIQIKMIFNCTIISFFTEMRRN